MQFVGIGGEPCTGKSSLMREFLRLALLRDCKLIEWRFKSLRGIQCIEEKWLVLGVYPEGCTDSTHYTGSFFGTDRLAFVAKRDFTCWLSQNQDPMTVLFEGDRLFNLKTLKELSGKTLFFILQTNNDELLERHQARAESQSESFLKRQKTKIKNISNDKLVRVVENNNLQDRDKIIKTIMNFLLAN